MSHIKGFFKKITGLAKIKTILEYVRINVFKCLVFLSDTTAYDALSKQPIIDAELKLNLFREVTSASISGIENYLKYMVNGSTLISV